MVEKRLSLQRTINKVCQLSLHWRVARRLTAYLKTVTETSEKAATRVKMKTEPKRWINC